MTQRQNLYSALKCLGAVLLAAAPLAAAHAGQPQDAGHGHRFITQTDRLIVKYKDARGPAVAAALPAARQAIVDRAGQQFGATLRALRATAGGAHVFQMNHSMTLDQARQLAADLKSRDSSVEYAEPDRIMSALATPSDPSYSQQWDLYETAGGINAPAAWDKSTGAGIKVAVIDTGYRPHADLAGQILQGYDFITNTTIANDGNGRDSDASDPGDWTLAGQCAAGVPAADENSSWHGTHVAGTIAARANNGIGVAGIAYNAKIVPARVLGKCGGYTSDIADAIVWASGGSVAGVPANANQARVLNLSLGGSGACDSTTQNAINSARSRGAVVVVAAGNSNADASTSSPANCAGVIAVAATGRSGGKASYSNYGSSVTIAAPGGDFGAGILSTLNAGTTTPGADSYANYMGTSMATPHVAGVVALMLAANPNLTPDEVAAKLKSSARAFPAACAGCGAGIVDAAAAVNASLPPATTSPTPAPTPTWTACASENATCNFSGSAQVRYGANGVYATRTLTGPVACSNATFGDPIPHTAKSCSYSSTSATSPTPTPAPAPTPAPTPTPAPAPTPTPAPSTWTACAIENGTCNFSGSAQVRYGANGVYATMTLTGPVACNNATFGDPAPHTAKSCSYSAVAATAVTWTTCANENGTCSFSGTRQVRYGGNGMYYTKVFTGSTACSNAVFTDPVQGVAKTCSYSSATQ